MTIKQLSDIVKKNGFVYRKIMRNQSYAIYGQYYPDSINPISYEVIQIQVRGGYKFKGKFIAPYETMPQSSKWGYLGYTYRTLEQAKEKLFQLCSPLEGKGVLNAS